MTRRSQLAPAKGGRAGPTEPGRQMTNEKNKNKKYKIKKVAEAAGW